MQKTFKNKYFLFKKKLYKQTWQKYYNIFSVSFKQNKKSLLLLIPENIGDRLLLCVKLKCYLNLRKKVIRCFKN